MKTAKAMKEISLNHCPVGNYIETTIAAQIEKAAQNGDRTIRIHTDRIPAQGSRRAIVEMVRDYLHRFHYTSDYTSDYKNIDIYW
jgi:hypothetical protein